MKLVLFNASPRNKKSNSNRLLEHFIAGYKNAQGEGEIELLHLAEEKKRKQHLQAFQQADAVIIAFPLYTDAMPGMLKSFIEDFVELPLDNQKHLGFIVQSGFPESKHSVYVARYLAKLIKRLGLHSTGVVIKGGVEGIQIMPNWMTKKLFRQFRELGAAYAIQPVFDKRIKEQLAKPYLLSKGRKLFFRLMQRTGMANFYWDSQLKKNGAFDRRFDKPFE